MKQSLNLKLSQQLTLTPQLKQSLKLLQLPSLDLEQEIQQTLDANPLLERVENEAVDAPIVTEVAPAQDNGVPQPIAEAADPSFELERNDTLAPEQSLAENWSAPDTAWQEPQRLSNTSNNGEGTTEFTHYVSKQETLFEHLDWQVQMTALSAKDKLIARSILHSLDDDGYLGASLNDIAGTFDLEVEVDEDEVAAMLSLIKTLDPIGAGARNLSERLAILLELEPQETPHLEDAKLIVAQYLDLVGTRNFTKLKKELSLNDDALGQSLSLITQLNPRIGTAFQSDNENYIVPDVIVKKVGEHWLAQLNPDNQTKLRLNKTYSDMLKVNTKLSLEKDDSDYIQQNLLDAKIFIKGLMSRYDTLLLVAEAIVERQQAFFEKGDQAMQAMILQDIAQALDMHESTISRATAGKYLLSPHGVTELKYFFSSALTTTDGAGSSSTAIRSLIKKMVENEVKTKPLSDSKIAKELEQQGHIVARRTVAKYRESMHIAPSSQRKALS